ncbi:putative protein phosphatase 2C 62 [Raphanus sativus]|nr:putative protein phosphatase 2C 62 [Raphanus sativus]
MADPLMLLSLQPPPLPFLIFSSSYSSLHRRWGLSRSGIRFSVSEFRLSSQLQLANSTSPSQSSSTAPEKFDLVSTTQLKDGSQVFRFGDASEVERYRETEEKARCLELERKQHAEIEEEEASEGVRDGGHALADLDPVSELESLKEKSVVKIKPVKSSTETVSEKEYGAPPPARLSSVIKIKDRKRVRSPAKKKKETPIPVTVSGSEDEAEAKIASVSNLNSIVSVAEVIPTSATEEKTNENVEPLSSQVMEKVSVNEIRGDCETNGYQQLTESRVEEQATPISSSSQHGSQLNDLKEVAHTFEAEENLVVEPAATVELDVSPDGLVVVSPEENLVVEPTATVDVSPDELVVVSPEENLVVEPTATVSVSPDELVVVSPDENLVVEPIATVYVSPGELISTSEATNHSIEETAETPVVDTSEMANDGENGTSTIEDEVAVIDSKNDNGSISKTVNDTNDENLQLPEPETASLQPIEVVSVREELVSKAFYLESGSASLQNPFKALAGREDAYFISENNNWLGVADGVSQWSFEEINEGMHAQELMSNLSMRLSHLDHPQPWLLILAIMNSTLPILETQDSFSSGTEQYCRSQLLCFIIFVFPLHVTRGDDVLKLAEVYNVNVEEGDVILTATDGLFDNLYEKEIVSIVCRLLEQGLEPQRIAELIAAKAQEVGRSKTERTPFSDAAKEEGHDGYRGGKLDAVTVIVSLVKTVSS